MDYFYKIKITKGRELLFRELTLQEYKNLQKICIEDDLDIFKSFALEMIKGLCKNVVLDELNLIDIYIILLYIRIYSISDEKSFTTYIDGKSGIVKMNIGKLIDKVMVVYERNNFEEYVQIPISGFQLADYILLDIFDIQPIKGFGKDEKTFLIDDKNVENYIPLFVKTQIDEQVKNIYKEFSDIILFELTDDKNMVTKVRFELTENFIYTFIKTLFKDNLKSLYQNIFDLKNTMGINFEEHKYMTVSEMEIYVTMFNKEQERLQNENKSNSNSPLPATP